MRKLNSLARKIFGTTGDRHNAAVRSMIAAINALESQLQAASDDDLQQIAKNLKLRAQGGEPLDRLLPEAFATCRETASRTIGLRAFDVQLLGGIFLHQGNVVEMQTGEGKTLVATFPAYLNSLAGNSVHVVTVNDYLAKRDAEWMGRVYAKLGLSVGVIYHGQSESAKRSAYTADITYATFNELGFDYLRDNLKSSLVDLVQRDLVFAIIDEVDSVLIDEARTPLVISGSRQDHSGTHQKVDAIINRLQPRHYIRDPDSFGVSFTESGDQFLESELRSSGLLREDQTLYDHGNVALVHTVLQALRAHQMYVKDQHYIVSDDQVQLIDQNTGRVMKGRRLSDGLHQAIEAKEKVSVSADSVTIASVTVQNFFRLYRRLSGMTGTAATDADEFSETYKLGVRSLAPNKPLRRRDHPDRIFHTAEDKLSAIIDTIRKAHANGQPTLVGTTSVAKSEQISQLLSDIGIDHDLLNAREHEREALIVSNAGRPGRVTVATNMAGRGTDIQFGGSLDAKIARAIDEQPSEDPDAIRVQIEKEHTIERERVLATGGLLVLSVDRNESRRIDNQLRGRAGRQGDPGESCFYISLEDELLEKYEPKGLKRFRSKFEGKSVEIPATQVTTKLIEGAQIKAEERNLEIRKQLLKYDDVLNDQRKIIFGLRSDLLKGEDVATMVNDMRNQAIDGLVEQFLMDESTIGDFEGLLVACRQQLNLELPAGELADGKIVETNIVKTKLKELAADLSEKKWQSFGSEAMWSTQKLLLLQTIDNSWREHLFQLEYLRSVVGYRSAGKRNPLFEYRTEAFNLFEKMIQAVQSQVTTSLANLQPLIIDRQIDLMTELFNQKKSIPVPKAESDANQPSHFESDNSTN